MKKILFAIAIVLTIGMTASAQRGTDGLFNNFNNDNYNNRVGTGNDIVAPDHGFTGYAHADGTAVPLGSGLLVLTALGAGYALTRKRNK